MSLEGDPEAGKARLLGRLEARAVRAPGVGAVLLPAARFIRTQEISGAPLLAAAVTALVWANSPWADAYHALWDSELTLELWGLSHRESVRGWIADLLLPLFFFVAGLEIKRELVRGELSSYEQAAFPVAVALGGMLVPALAYLLFAGDGGSRSGWGIPVATDIAFALGVLAVLGGRVPSELKVLVLAFAAADDVGAVLVVALFYSHEIEAIALAAAIAALAACYGARQLGVRDTGIYWALGVFCVLATLRSGIHTTVSGVILGLLAPARPWLHRGEFASASGRLSERLREIQAQREALSSRDEHDREAHEERLRLDAEESTLLGHFEELATGTEAVVERLTRRVTPWVSYAVLPLFALASAGVTLDGDALLAVLSSPVGQGILAGLCLGKPLGFLGFAWLAVRVGIAQPPDRVGFPELAGAGFLAGIGFTISLFIAELAFAHDPERLAIAKGAVFLASLLAGLAGYTLLRCVSPSEPPASEAGTGRS